MNVLWYVIFTHKHLSPITFPKLHIFILSCILVMRCKCVLGFLCLDLSLTSVYYKYIFLFYV